MSYSDQTLKKLFALSGNVCAFPGCPAPIVDTDTGVVGDICHIKGKSENGPRHDPTQSDGDRNSYENLLVMCVAHNRIVDGRKTRNQYPVERLQEFKRNHEARYQGSVIDNTILDAFVEEFVASGSAITTYNQSGGQNANTIHNVYAHPPGAEREADEEDRAWALFSEFYKASFTEYAVNQVKGKEAVEALAALAFLPAMSSVSHLRAQTEDHVRNSPTALLFPLVMYSTDGRVSARPSSRPANREQQIEEQVSAQMFNSSNMLRQWAAQTLLLPAINQINEEHHVR